MKRLRRWLWKTLKRVDPGVTIQAVGERARSMGLETSSAVGAETPHRHPRKSPALKSRFPSTKGDEPATTDHHVRGEVQDLRPPPPPKIPDCDTCDNGRALAVGEGCPICERFHQKAPQTDSYRGWLFTRPVSLADFPLNPVKQAAMMIRAMRERGDDPYGFGPWVEVFVRRKCASCPKWIHEDRLYAVGSGGRRSKKICIDCFWELTHPEESHTFEVAVAGSKPMRIPAPDEEKARSRGTRRILARVRPDLAGPDFNERAKELEPTATVRRV